MTLQTQERQALKTRKLWIPIAVVIGIVALIGVFAFRPRTVLIRAATVTRQPISAAISTNGTIEPVTGLEAHAPAPASVQRVFVKEGQRVRKGTLLLSLDDASLRAEAARALAQVKSAQADLQAVETGGTHEEVLTNRAELARAQQELQAAQRNLDAVRKLNQTGAASNAELQDAQARLKNAQEQASLLGQKSQNRYSPVERQRAQAAVDQAKSAYSAAQDALSKSNIRSTIDGTVYNLPVKQGAFVQAGDLLVQVANLSSVQVRAFVDEPDIGRLAEGQKVRVTWDALPGRTWDGTVTRVPSTVTLRGTRTVGVVTCTIDNQDLKLLPNINVSVVITTAHDENAITVPREAVHQDEGQRYVFLVKNDKLVRQPVETSISNLTLIEITKGVQDGQTVALNSVAGQALRDGTPVTIEK